MTPSERPPHRGWQLPWSHSSAPLPAAVRQQLTDALFDMTLPIAVMGTAQLIIAALAARQWHALVPSLIAFASGVVTLLRVLIIEAYRRERAEPLSPERLRTWERRYGAGSVASGLLLGGLNLWALSLHYPLLHLITVSLVFTFGAGNVSRIAARPLICILSLLAAALPTSLALALHAASDHPIPLHSALFALASLLVAGTAALSLESVLRIYRTAVALLVTQHDLAQLAKQDTLTGLANRLRMRERYQEGIETLARTSRRMALHALDLDGFKAVNDSQGHLAGDAVLQQVADRLRAVVRASDTVVRLGGDEFVVIQNGIADESEAAMLAKRVVDTLSEPYDLGGAKVTISVSVGIAIVPEIGADLEERIACADAALYDAKLAGKGQFRFCELPADPATETSRKAA